MTRFLYMYSLRMGRTPVSDDAKSLGTALGLALARHRDTSGLSGQRLSVATGYSLDAIRSVETGRVASPGFFLVAALSQELDVSLDALAKEARESATSTKPKTTAPKRSRPSSKASSGADRGDRPTQGGKA